MAAGESIVGSILGYLRLDADQFHREIERAITEADVLDGKDIDVKVKVDTAAAETKLAAVDAAEKKVDDSNTRISRSGREAGRGMGALATAIITLGPAIIPLAVATTGLAVGFSAMGAAGILAVVGIVQEMKAGSAVGQQFSKDVSVLKGNLQTLARTAAGRVLGSFNDAVIDLQRRMPVLNSIIGEFAAVTGRTAGALTSGLLSALIALEPLARDVGVYVLGLSERFAALMAGPGVRTFGDYVRSVFPQVMQAIESIVGAVIHLMAALAPLGMGTLAALRAFADAINAIPVDVLAQVATVAAAAFLGVRAFQLLTGPLKSLSTGLQMVGVSAEAAATGVRVLTVASGVIGALLTAASFLFMRHAEAVRENQAAVNDYTDALRQSNGALDENVRLMTYKNLVDSGAIEAARNLGYSLADVTSAAMGNTEALARVNAHTDAVRGSLKEAAASGADLGATYVGMSDDIKKVSDSINGNNSTLNAGKQAWADQQAAMTSATVASDGQYRSQGNLARALGTTLPVMQAVVDAQQKQADTAAQATLKMQLENDAAGILKQSLDLLNGKTISAADAQNAFDSSLVNMGTHTTSTGKKIQFTTANINNMSAASVALRGQLNGQVENLQRVIEANGGLSNSTARSRDQMKTMRQQIIDNAVAHGVDRKAVTAYIDSLLKIPRTIPPTKLDVQSAAAEAKTKRLKGAIDSIPAAKQAYIDERGAVPARLRIMELQDAIDRLKGKTVNITTRITTGKFAGKQVKIDQANGAVLSSYASGGFENHVAQIAPAGAMRLWAEPETGGEAYIPLAPSKRARSMAIWEETGRRLGVEGGGSSPVALDAATIQALAAAMSRVQLAAVVSAGSVDRAMVGGMR